MSAIPNPILRKPVQRAFTRRLVGLPPEPEQIPVQAEPAQSSIAHAQATVDRLMEAVAAAKTNEKVKQAVQESFAPAQVAPVKRGRGRPRKYDGATVQERERNRKRVTRSKASLELAKLLRYFELEVTSAISPGLKTKYGLEVNTYRELLDSEKVKTKVIKDIFRDLKMIGAIKTPTSCKLSTGKFMTDAPHGKGELVYSDKPGHIHELRQQREKDLSKPEQSDGPAMPSSLLGSDELPTGDRRRVRPKGHGPDDAEE
jgi:hypothetical protein